MNYLPLIIFLVIFNSLFITTYTLVLKRVFFYFQKKVKKRYIILFLILFLSSFIFLRRFSNSFLLSFTTVLNYTLGFLAILLFYVFCFEFFFIIKKIINKILKKENQNLKSNKMGIALMILCLVTFCYAFYSFGQFQVTRYTIESNKIKKDYKFIQITDTQYGSLNKKDMKKISTMVNKILQKEKIDFILFTGDAIDTHIFDSNTFDEFDFKIPQFFTLGNHEFYHNLEKILTVMQEKNYKILRNENFIFDELNIIGIDDANDKKQVLKIFQEKKELIAKNKYNILGYHRPVGALAAKQAGVDFMLSGHTHGGQLFPYSLILKLIYPYPQGLVDLGNFYLFTSDGIGVWGPKLRILTKSEITVFHLMAK